MEKLFFAMMAVSLACGTSGTTKKTQTHQPEQPTPQHTYPRPTQQRIHATELLQVNFDYWPDTKYLRMMAWVGDSWEILHVKVKTGERTHNVASDSDKEMTKVPGPFEWENSVLDICPIAEVTSSKVLRSGIFLRYDSACENVLDFESDN